MCFFSLGRDWECLTQLWQEANELGAKEGEVGKLCCAADPKLILQELGFQEA